MAMMICGIAASSAVDTAGESIDIAGLDISSLVGAMVNFEHKSEKSSDYVGRIIKAKKIFGPEDCSNDIELKYWNKCQLSFLFCLCSLFNDFQPSAKEVAGIFDYDEANKSPICALGFSIEGSKLCKEGHIITHSIARKLTLTSSPANKTCIADKVSLETDNLDSNISPKTDKDPLSFLFKSVEIELFKSEDFNDLEKADIPKSPKPSAPSPVAPTPVANNVTVTRAANLGAPKSPKPAKVGLKQGSSNPGQQIGTADGQSIMSHKKVHEYENLSAEGHRTAANLHSNAATAANTARDPKMAMHHNQKMQLHNRAAASLERRANRFGNAQKAKENKAVVNKILGKSEEVLEKSRGKQSDHMDMILSSTKHVGNKYFIAHVERDKMRAAKKLVDQGKIKHHGAFSDSHGGGHIYVHPDHKEDLNKALTASDGMVAPDHKTGGAALQGEKLEPLMKPYTSEAQRRWAHTENIDKSGDKLGQPLHDKIPGKDMSWGYKAAMGTSRMGGKIRRPELNYAFSAKETAQKELKRIKDAPKPNLPKSEEMDKAESPFVAGWNKDSDGFHSKEILHHGTASKEHHMLWVQPQEGGKGHKWSVMHHKNSIDTPTEIASGHSNNENHAKIDALSAYAKHKVSKSEEMDKALEAGSGLASPGQLNQGSALTASEKPKKKKKSKLLMRAEEAYEMWGKKEEFRGFMKKRLPHLTKAEIDSLGKTLLLKKTLQAEKDLSELVKPKK